MSPCPHRVGAAALALALAVVSAASAGGCADVLFYEDFSSLAGWTVINGGDPPGHGGGRAPTWTLANPGNRELPELAEPFAIVDSDYNLFNRMNEDLISPPLDASALVCVTLAFSHVFKWYDGPPDELAEVRVRSDATWDEVAQENAWVTVATFTGGDAGGLEILDLSAYAAAELQVSFRYSNALWEWYWAVDDVALLGAGVEIFADGFESGATSAWSVTSP